MSSALIIPQTERLTVATVDWVHPNPVGDEKLARNWFAALTPFLAENKALPEASATAPISTRW